jgi:hypothetical protein
MTLEDAAPPGTTDQPVIPEPSEMLQRITAIQVRDQQLVANCHTALAFAASLARLARAYRRDRDRLTLACRGLQRQLEAATITDRVQVAQISFLAGEIVDLGGRIEALTAENTRLRDAASVPAPVEPKRRWRR